MSRIKMIVACLGVASLFLFVGCGKEDPKNMTKEQLVEKMGSVMKEMSEAIKSNKGNCDGMAKALEGVMGDAKALKARGDELEKDPETKKWLDEKGKEMMGTVMPVMMEAMAAAEECKDHEGVKKAMEAL